MNRSFFYEYVLYDVSRGVDFIFKQKTAYEMRISDWISDVCSSDLPRPRGRAGPIPPASGSPADRTAAPRCRRARQATAQASGAIGRASCRERVCQYVYISVVAV